MEALARRLGATVGPDGSLLILTGAGISAESGVPTFRGEEGYWTLGSQNFHPQEMATAAMFRQDPIGVWSWYLHRLELCRDAAPNPAHEAIANADSRLGERLTLITQNVDGLHARAGSSPERTLAIHGDIQRMRCVAGCSSELHDVPVSIGGVERGHRASPEQIRALRCPRCEGSTRPHVLWFDECYDETLYRIESALDAARRADAVISVGTTGTTNLPQMILEISRKREVFLVDVNPAPNPFGSAADAAGAWVRDRAGSVLPRLLASLR
jgi:NAD-dependent deacetylase